MKNRKHKGKYVVWQCSKRRQQELRAYTTLCLAEICEKRDRESIHRYKLTYTHTHSRTEWENRNKRKSILCALAFNIRTSAKVMNESNIIFIFSWFQSLQPLTPSSLILFLCFSLCEIASSVCDKYTLLNSFPNETNDNNKNIEWKWGRKKKEKRAKSQHVKASQNIWQFIIVAFFYTKHRAKKSVLMYSLSRYLTSIEISNCRNGECSCFIFSSVSSCFCRCSLFVVD